MSASALLTNMTFHHLSILAFLIGAQIYQSFFANIVAVRALTRPQFRILQASIWPMYFKLQTTLCVLLALTRLAAFGGGEQGQHTSAQGMFGAKNERWTVVLNLTAMVVLAATNMLTLVPRTHQYGGKVHMLSVREEKVKGKGAAESAELWQCRVKLIASHGASFLFNMGVIILSIRYAMGIAASAL